MERNAVGNRTKTRPLWGAWLPALGAGGWLMATVVGSAQPHDPLTERCLEALARHTPDHGRVEQIERGPSEEGWMVTILHRAASRAPETAERFSCEYEVGDRWRTLRIAAERSSQRGGA